MQFVPLTSELAKNTGLFGIVSQMVDQSSFFGNHFLEIIWLIFHFRPLIMSIIGLHTNVHLFTILTFRFENRDPPPPSLEENNPKNSPFCRRGGRNPSSHIFR